MGERKGRHIAHIWVTAQDLFNLGGKNIDAVHDHHLICTSQMNQLTVFGQTAQITRIEPSVMKTILIAATKILGHHARRARAYFTNLTSTQHSALAVNDLKLYAVGGPANCTFFGQTHICRGHSDAIKFV